MTTLPFAVSSADFPVAARHQPVRPLVAFGDGHIHHVYVGRCGADMRVALTILFRAFREFRTQHPADGDRIRFHFIGTDYAPPPLGRTWVLPTAQAEGVAACVSEHNYRVPYFDALYYLIHADALMIVSSNDATYSASKVYPCLLARRPLLVVAHNASPMLAPIREEGAARCFTFDDRGITPDLVSEVAETWFHQAGWRQQPASTGRLLEHHGAAAMTRQLAGLFDQVAAARSN